MEIEKLSWRLHGSFSTESASSIPGVHMCLYTWRPFATLIQKVQSLACHRHNSNIMLSLAPYNNFSLFNAGLVLMPGPKHPEEINAPAGIRDNTVCTKSKWTMLLRQENMLA